MLAKEPFLDGKITIIQSFLIMRNFLERYYQRALVVAKMHDMSQDLAINDIAILLKRLDIDIDGKILDKLIAQYWNEALRQVIHNQQITDQLTVLHVYFITRAFLKEYVTKNIAEDVDMFVYQMSILDDWIASILSVMNVQSLVLKE